jgi:hypothetical protein
MANELDLPRNFGPVSSVFAGSQATNDELGAGVASSYGIIGYKGKVWSIRHQGNEQILMRDDGDGPRNSIEVVLIKASPAISKIFYKQGYVDGSNAAPDCWSANGQTPDASVQNKVSPTCANCPMNAWGSRVTEAGKQGKACSDSRRVAVVPVADIANELFGGPMLLRIPAASLKDLKSYGDALNSYQYPYYAVATRVAFDPKEAYPKFVFSAVRPLTDDEARQVMELREDRKVGAVLSETVDAVASPAAAPVPASPFEQAPVPASPFEQPVTQPVTQQGNPAPQPAAAPAQPVQQPAQQPAQQPVQQPVQQEVPKNPFANTAPAQQASPAAPAQQATTAPSQAAASAPANDDSQSTGVSSFDDLLDKVL